ncbi:glycosyltransferase [Pectobacterium sp. B1J-3]|uniref:glycosyltransferase n=1 Tax=Pectobacterium sp. B1J-3 TaxID=3385371 RepID=UPI003905C7BB
MTDKIVVIMSVYYSDAPDDFKLAVDSMLSQSVYCDIFIYRDGAVSEELDRILKFFLNEKRIKIFPSETNNGLAYALNSLIDVAVSNNYDFVARMDSDDISRNDRLYKQISYFKDNQDVDICGGLCREFNSEYALEKKQVPMFHDDLVDYSIARCPFIHPTVMFRISVFKNGYRYPVNTSFSEDMALWYNLILNGYKLGNVNEILLDYRLNDKTLSRRKGIKKAWSEVALRFNYMIALRRCSIKNVFFLFFRFFFHLMPVVFTKVLYKRMR